MGNSNSKSSNSSASVLPIIGSEGATGINSSNNLDNGNSSVSSKRDTTENQTNESEISSMSLTTENVSLSKENSMNCISENNNNIGNNDDNDDNSGNNENAERIQGKIDKNNDKINEKVPSTGVSTFGSYDVDDSVGEIKGSRGISSAITDDYFTIIRQIEKHKIDLLGIVPPWLEPIRRSMIKILYPNYSREQKFQCGDVTAHNIDKMGSILDTSEITPSASIDTKLNDKLLVVTHVEDETDREQQVRQQVEQQEIIAKNSRTFEGLKSDDSNSSENFDNNDNNNHYDDSNENNNDSNSGRDGNAKDSTSSVVEGIVSIDDNTVMKGNDAKEKHDINQQKSSSIKATFPPSKDLEIGGGDAIELNEDLVDNTSSMSVLPPNTTIKSAIYTALYADARFRQFITLTSIFESSDDGVYVSECTCVDMSINRIRSLDFPSRTLSYENLLCLNVSNNFLVSLNGIQICKSLIYIDASHNMIQDETAMYQCPSLQGMTLQRNRLTRITLIHDGQHTLDDNDSNNNSNTCCPETTYDDQDNKDNRDIKDLPSISYLNVDRNFICKQHKMFARSPSYVNLIRISANYCRIQSLALFKDLSQLEELYCLHNEINNLQEVGGVLCSLVSLKIINMIGNPIEQVSEGQAYMVNLLLRCPTIREFDMIKIPFHLIDHLIIQKASEEGIRTESLNNGDNSDDCIIEKINANTDIANQRQKFDEDLSLASAEVDEQLLKLRKLRAKIQEKHDKEARFIGEIISERKEILSKESLILQNIQPMSSI